MINDEQRLFIEGLGQDEFREFCERGLYLAKGELTRRGLPLSSYDARDVLNSALDRVLSSGNVAWQDESPSIEGLLAFLRKRIDDVVRAINRHRNQEARVRPLKRQHSHSCPPTMISEISAKRIETALLDRACEAGEDQGRIAMELLTGAEKPREQALATGIKLKRVYRLRTEVRNMLTQIISEMEVEQ